MNQYNHRFDPPDELSGEEFEPLSREEIERVRIVRNAIDAGLRSHRESGLRLADALHLLELMSYQSGGPTRHLGWWAGR